MSALGALEGAYFGYRGPHIQASWTSSGGHITIMLAWMGGSRRKLKAVQHRVVGKATAAAAATSGAAQIGGPWLLHTTSRPTTPSKKKKPQPVPAGAAFTTGSPSFLAFILCEMDNGSTHSRPCQEQGVDRQIVQAMQLSSVLQRWQPGRVHQRVLVPARGPNTRLQMQLVGAS